MEKENVKIKNYTTIKGNFKIKFSCQPKCVNFIIFNHFIQIKVKIN